MNLPAKTYALPSDPCSDLYVRVAAKSRAPIARIRITKGSDGALVPNDEKTTVDEFGLYEGNTIHVKDLGEHTVPTVMSIVLMGTFVQDHRLPGKQSLSSNMLGRLSYTPCSFSCVAYYIVAQRPRPRRRSFPSGSLCFILLSASTRLSSFTASPMPPCLWSTSSRTPHIIGCSPA